MSNRRRPPSVPPVAGFLRQFDGARIPGGCEFCDAYQTIKSPAYDHPAITMLTVHHDDWCPFLAQYEGRA